MKRSFTILLVACSVVTFGQNKFAQLGTDLPTPNVYRTASGAPGHAYYQQKADYEIDVRIDDKTQRIDGKQTITYTNNSPDALSYLWIQLDQNMRAQDSDTKKIRQMNLEEGASYDDIKGLHNDFDGGFKLMKVTDAAGKDIPYTVVKTMMRVDIPDAPEKRRILFHEDRILVQHQRPHADRRSLRI